MVRTEITISGLSYYPIKSCAGTAVQEAVLDEQGIRYDRRWMVVRAEDGRFLTQREYPHMAVIHPTVAADCLAVAMPGTTTLSVPFAPDTERNRAEITVWGFTGEALDEGDEAAAWFSDALGLPCRLVRTPGDFTRRVNPNYARPQDRVGFADGYPVLLASEESLADLNARLDLPLPMNRFRPNIVITGAAPFAEDNWQKLHLPARDVTFRVSRPCARCAITTIEQTIGEKTGPEPLAALARFRRADDNKVMFGMNLIHDWRDQPLRLYVGDTVVVD